MSNPGLPGRLSFEDNIHALLEELILAEKWQRPSILLAVHKSKFGQDKAEKALEDRLKKLGQNVTNITVDKAHSDVPHWLAAASPAQQTVFFVSNLDWGGGDDRRDAYRALNIYRELFVEHKLRVVLWLTVHEAAALARYAPDFWAFRHRVIEFTGQRIPRRVTLPAGVLIWDIQNPVDPSDTPEARISIRLDLLGRLPHDAEARSARVDLLCNLGYLYWATGNSEEAIRRLRAGLELIGNEPAGRMKSSLLNGLAIISYEAREYERALEMFGEALRESPADSSLLMNLSACYSALGRNQDAASFAQKAARINPRDARVWNAMGYVNAALGKFDEAITCFIKAVDLEPRMATYHAALAICYNLVERTDEAARHLELARKFAAGQTRIYMDVYESAIIGNTAKSLELAHAAVRAKQLLPYDLRRDPGLSLLLASPQIEGLSAP